MTQAAGQSAADRWRVVCAARVTAFATAAAASMLLLLGGCDSASSSSEEKDISVTEVRAGRRDDGAPVPAVIETPVTASVVVPAARPMEALESGTGCVNAQCHATFETARQVHGAVSAGDCFVCHGQDVGGHVYPLVRSGNETCTFCHTVTGNREHQHAAVELPGCVACHRPHVSDTKYLLTAGSIEDVCRQCHLTESGSADHEPFAAGECTACHQPHESTSAGLLRGGTGLDHCAMCHTQIEYQMTNAPYLHAPATESCTSCHSPHAADYPDTLRRPLEETCFGCHEDLEREVAGATAPHAAVFTAERCGNCHDPHGAGRPHLLRDRQDVLCLQCHDRELAAADGRTIRNMEPLLRDRVFLHGPVEAGECSACHNAHGSTHARLLRENFTDAFYEPFELGSYALCFSCHEQELVLTEQTTSLTGFRDGDRNLHFLHVNRAEKGRTCSTCHDIHGSDLPRHMADTVPFEGSQWAMPIDFRKTRVGGSCAPGCHAPMSYDRGPANGSSRTAPQGGAP